MPSASTPLDISSQLEALSRSLVAALPELGHIELDTVIFTYSRSRRAGRGGLLARITPLRGRSGSRHLERSRGRYRETWEIPSLIHEGRDILYIVTILVPRFLLLDPRERLTTLLHELWHISPQCDGDIRRFSGPNYAHGCKTQGFHATVEALATRFLAGNPGLPKLLTLSAAEWQEGHTRLCGLRIRRPRARLVARQRR